MILGAWILLCAGVALELACCLGVAVMRSSYDRLHFTGPASLGAALVAGAIGVQEGFSLIADKAILVAVLLLATSPVLVHATARSLRIREHGDWTPQPHEGLEPEEP